MFSIPTMLIALYFARRRMRAKAANALLQGGVDTNAS